MLILHKNILPFFVANGIEIALLGIQSNDL
jgi:hypothetical protein